MRLLQNRNNGRVEKVNIENWYQTYAFNQAIQYANKNINLLGVSDILSTLNGNAKNYKEEMDDLFERVRPIADKRFEQWSSIYKIFTLCKWICIVTGVLFFVGICVQENVIFLISGIVSFLAAILLAILKIVKDILRYRYNSYIKNMGQEANRIVTKYERTAYSAYDETDRIYLNSLEPLHREAVLARRDQERQHQELMSAQLQHQKIVENEQRQIREAQQELLRIEKEREERYRRNRY